MSRMTPVQALAGAMFVTNRFNGPRWTPPEVWAAEIVKILGEIGWRVEPTSLAAAERAVVEAAVRWGTDTDEDEEANREIGWQLHTAVRKLLRLRAAQESGTQEILDK